MSLLDPFAPTSSVRRDHLEGWPASCSISPDGGLLLGSRRLDGIAAVWGSPLFVLDEATVRRGVDEVTQVRGLRPLFNTTGALSATVTKWSVESGWDMWGPAVSLARAWARGVPEHRTVLDLRYSSVPAQEPPPGVRIAVSAAALDVDTPRWMRTRTIFLGIDGAYGPTLDDASRWLAAYQRRFGIVITLNIAESPDQAAQRVVRCLAAVTTGTGSEPDEMIIDAADHPQPMPAVHAVHRGMRKDWARSELEPGVLVDLTRNLLYRSSLELTAVTGVRHDPTGSLIEIDAPIRSRSLGPDRTPVRLASRVSHGRALPMQLRCRGKSLGAVRLPVDVRQGDLLAIAGPHGPHGPQGACLVISAEIAVPVIRHIADPSGCCGVTPAEPGST